MSTQHPPIERLAELVDGTPTLFEREHVATCARCTSELESLRRLVSLAGDERRRIGPPVTAWESIRQGLDAEGLIAPPVAGRRPAAGRLWLLRAASMAVLLTGGAVVGRLSAGLPLAEAVAVASPSGERSLEGMRMMPVGLPSGGSTLHTAEEALAQLQRAQGAYEEAAAWLASHDTTTSTSASGQYRTRLAALDMASETFEQALADAPGDPVLNQYFQATMNAREVAIRRLGTTLPASVRVGRF